MTPCRWSLEQGGQTDLEALAAMKHTADHDLFYELVTKACLTLRVSGSLRVVEDDFPASWVSNIILATISSLS